MGKKPIVYVIAGSNGAGKTTFAEIYLPRYAQCMEFVNADMVAWGISPFSPEAAKIRAARLVLGRIRELAKLGRDFGFETTLSGRGYAGTLRKLREAGYWIVIFYLWVPTPELAISRVADRVRNGGHSIPEPDIRRRFRRSLVNLFHIYAQLADEVSVFDNSGTRPQLFAIMADKRWQEIDPGLFRKMREGVG